MAFAGTREKLMIQKIGGMTGNFRSNERWKFCSPTATVTIYNNDVPTVRIATTTTLTSDADLIVRVCGD